jgi:DNA-binding MarR family transcriptional regulator
MNLTTNEAIVLQQIHEDGEDDARTLSRMLGMSRHHVLSIVGRLKSKGLVAIEGAYDGLWVHLTREGRRLMNYVWPEARANQHA